MRRRLFIDEAGSFNEPDDQERAVGGLLLVGDDDHQPDAEAIHDCAAQAIQWPVRLHGRELRSAGFAALWLRTMAEPPDVLGAWARGVTVAQPYTSGRAWAKPAERWAKANRRAPPLSAPKELGNWLAEQRKQVRDTIVGALRDDCRGKARAAAVLGDVHEPGSGLPVYLIGLRRALRAAKRAAPAEGAWEVYIADPNLGRASDIERVVRATLATTHMEVSVTQYDNAPAGVWLADSLLGWMRGRWSLAKNELRDRARRCVFVECCAGVGEDWGDAAVGCTEEEA